MPKFVPPTPAASININEAQYLKFAQLIYRLAGIHLGNDKKNLLRARLAKRFRATGCHDVSSYMQRLQDDPGGEELVNFLDCITTNKTDFFREPQHFDFMAQQVLPNLDEFCEAGQPLRIWCAACSTGEEPYTLAMVLKDNKRHWRKRGLKLLASDLSTQVLATGKNGVYAMDRVSNLPRDVVTRHFQRGTGRFDGHVRVRPDLRSMVQFERINLMDPFKFGGTFHMIFCRNVMIYFDKETRERLVNKFHALLPNGGYLFVGHSESLTGIKHRLKFVRPAVYRRED